MSEGRSRQGQVHKKASPVVVGAFSLLLCLALPSQILRAGTAIATLSNPTPATINIIAGGSTSLGAEISNTGTASLNLTVPVNNGSTGGSLTMNFGNAPAVLSAGLNAEFAGTFTANSSPGLGLDWSIVENSGNGGSPVTGGTVNVYGHAVPTFTAGTLVAGTNTGGIPGSAAITTDTIILPNVVQAAGSKNINVGNLLANIGSPSTVNMALTSAMLSSQTGTAISYSISNFGGVAGNSIESNGGTVTVQTGTAGSYVSTYTLKLGDDTAQGVIGATQTENLVLHIDGTVTPSNASDPLLFEANSSSVSGYTDAHTVGTSQSNPAVGGFDVNVARTGPASYIPGYLNKINGGAGVTKGYVTVGGFQSGDQEIVGLAIHVTDGTYSGPLSGDTNNPNEWATISSDLERGALNSDSSPVTVESFGALNPAAQSALAVPEAANGGQPFDIAIVTSDPQYLAWDLTNEQVGSVTSISITDVGAVPEPSTGLVALVSLTAITRRRQRRAI